MTLDDGFSAASSGNAGRVGGEYCVLASTMPREEVSFACVSLSSNRLCRLVEESLAATRGEKDAEVVEEEAYSRQARAEEA